MEKVNEKNKVILFICYLLLSSNHERRDINRERERYILISNVFFLRSDDEWAEMTIDCSSSNIFCLYSSLTLLLFYFDHFARHSHR